MAKNPKPYDAEEDEDKEERDIGLCKDCQHFDIDREEDEIADDAHAPCLHPDLEEYELVVSGDCSCNLFELYEGEDDDEEDEEKEQEY
ncbi:MAG: hypothetical protein WCK47_09200 [bacterium]|nr:hypothetical protein [Candidatus Sumerlaeota bacterium]